MEQNSNSGSTVDPATQAKIERPQGSLSEKLSTIIDNKMEKMKLELEDMSNNTHASQMSELKRIRFSEPQVFKKKGHEAQYKYNEQVKTSVIEAKEAVQAGKHNACMTKLDEGIDMIEQCQFKSLF